MNTVICPICVKRMQYKYFTNVHKCCNVEDDDDDDERRMRREDREDKERGVWGGFGRRFR